MPSLDYTRLAAVYDDYCDFDRDIDFFLSLVAERRGRVLELMAGTGRMSVPLVEAGTELVCLDRSAAMLGVLRRKLDERKLGAALVCADVCAIPIRARLDTVILPFQGFCELVTEEEQRRAMVAVAGVLGSGGRFVCTTHNPAIRRRTLDGSWHQVSFPGRPGGRARVAFKATLDENTGIVTGQQRIEVADDSGHAREILCSLRFSLVSVSELVALAQAAGLRLLTLRGDYDGSAYDDATSPVVIATFARAARAGNPVRRRS